MAKKEAKNVVKKEVVKKDKKVKVPKVVAPKYELISFSITATIPVQAYGNLQPAIVLKTKTLEEAKEIAMPFMEDLFRAYAENPRDGSTATFMSKANVTVEEKRVTPTTVAPVAPTIPVAPATTEPAPETKQNPQAISATPAEVKKDEEVQPETQKSAPFVKAEKAIGSATSLEALELIENQIHKSEKLTADEKPVLLTLILKKRKEL